LLTVLSLARCDRRPVPLGTPSRASGVRRWSAKRSCRRPRRPRRRPRRRPLPLRLRRSAREGEEEPRQPVLLPVGIEQEIVYILYCKSHNIIYYVVEPQASKQAFQKSPLSPWWRSPLAPDVEPRPTLRGLSDPILTSTPVLASPRTSFSASASMLMLCIGFRRNVLRTCWALPAEPP
jgi:hypothetical protein